MTEPTLIAHLGPDGFLELELNRPESRNAVDPPTIAAVVDALDRARDDAQVRGVLISGRGATFCAGADLNWMRAAGADPDENRRSALLLARMYRTLYDLPKPTMARVHGAAFGGGVGLVACVDVAVAAERAVFSLSEVRLGAIPSVIGPYVMEAVGPRVARRLFITGERFTAHSAWRWGLVHEVTSDVQLDRTVNDLRGEIGLGGPEAVAEAKRYVRDVAGRPIDDDLTRETAERIARIRAGEEAREGFAAFLEKRKPRWLADKGATP